MSFTAMILKRNLLIATVLGLTLSLSVSAQKSAPKDSYVFPQQETPLGIDNYLFILYQNTEKDTYNLQGAPISHSKNPVKMMKVNPSGTTLAVLEVDKAGQSSLNVYSLWEADRKVHSFRGMKDIKAIGYTPDAKYLALATPGKITFMDARQFIPAFDISSPDEAVVSQIVFSPDSRNMALVDGKNIYVYDVESKKLRKSLDFEADITDADFSSFSDILAVLTNDGTLYQYDTARFFPMGNVDGLGKSSSLSFNPDDKYISVVTGDNRIAIINRMDDTDRDFLEDAIGGISEARFMKDYAGHVYMAYPTKNNITYKRMTKLLPNRTKLLSDELNERMEEWMKMMPDETLEQYNARVNDETRLAQMRLFEQEIATRLADNLVGMSDVALGNYIQESSKLAINFDNMPTIYLTVAENELNDFTNVGDLEFRNAKYGLTDNDKFELIYADVYNKKNGKTYTFDNLDRQSLAYLMANESFVPLELIQQSNLEEITLNDIKENIVNLAKQEEKVSDHTHFNVSSKIVTDTDNQGEKIMNYQINFSYEVDPGFSAQEDFAPGKYVIDESPAAKSMLQIIETALETDFAQYVKPGKKLI